MDDYMFRQHVHSCKNVVEDTSYVEIFNYEVSLSSSYQSRGAERSRFLSLPALLWNSARRKKCRKT